MKALKPTLLLFALGFMLLSSMKCKKDNQNPSKEQLPAITQTGANTFGFLLNGEVWLPKGGLLDQKLDLSYDPSYNGGALSIIANRLLGEKDKSFLSFGGTNVTQAGHYEFSSEKKSVYYYDNKKTDCEYHYSTTIITGSLTITKLDLINKFISGTFEFKLEKNGCPTINATQGRFDLKIE